MAQADLVSALTAAIGVKTFLEVPPSSYNAYTALPFATIDSDLRYLGVHLIREAAYNTQTSSPTLVAEFNTLANEGYKFDFGAGASAANMANLDQFVTLHPGALQSVEGPNEINYFPFAYDGKTGQAAATEFQSNANSAVKQDPLLAGVQVLDFTGGGGLLGAGQPYQTLPGNADLANVHLYPANGDPPAWYVSAIYNAQYGAPITAPFAVTEAGYNSDPNTTNGVSLDVQAKQTLSLVLDAAQSGATSIYLYQLLDQYADPGNTDPDNHWGLFNSDGSPKPVATALHNLTTILADPGASTGSTTPLGSVSYSSPNMPWGTHSWLLEKSNGVFDLVLWAEPKIWDPVAQAEISVASTPVTIDLGQSYQSIKLFDPLSGSTANASYTNTETVTVPISDHAVILEFSSSPVTMAASVQPAILQPLINIVTGNRDDGGTLAGSAHNSMVTVSDTTGGVMTTNAQSPADPINYSIEDPLGGVSTGLGTVSDAFPQDSPSQLPTISNSTVLPPFASFSGNKTAVYRFFDTGNGTQFLTTDVAERNTIITTRPDLNYEGVGMGSVKDPTTDANAAPVYRFFDTNNGSHFFTTSATEAANVATTRSDLQQEAPNVFEHVTQQADDAAVYRFFETSDGSHFYTNSASENASLIASRPDMVSEGVAFYAPKT